MNVLERKHNSANVVAAVSAQPKDDRRRLRIIHVVSSLLVGGMEQFVLQLAAEQRDSGHDVSILGLNGGPLVERAELMGLRATVMDDPNRFRRISMAIRHLVRNRPDVVNAHNPGALTYALLAKFRPRASVIMTRHGQEVINPLPSGFKLRLTDSVIAVSDAAARAMLAKKPQAAGRIATIKNGVHLAKPMRDRAAIRADLGLGDGLVGIIVARIDRLKGHNTLTEAAAKVRDRGIDFTVLIAGDGPERAKIEELAAERNLGPDRVKFLGFRNDVTDLLAASDLFLLPSLTEGMPLSVLEAMAQRLPVLCTPVGGIPELMDDGAQGTFFPVGDVDALTEAISRLAADPVLRRSMGEAGYQRVKERFSFSEMARRYEDLYYRFCR